MPDKAAIRALLEKLLNDTGETNDYQQLEWLLSAGRHDGLIREVLQELGEHIEPSHGYAPQAMEDVIKRILATEQETHTASENLQARRGVLRSMKKWSWAAAVLIAGIGAFMWFQGKEKKVPELVQAEQIPEIVPGRDGATLVLDDGTEIVLDSLGNGFVAAQKGSRVELVDGRLTYNTTGANTGEIAFNTMRTPAGRQFQMQLPDGTQVWLNAGSSVRYPTRFVGRERRVSITGEAYFEVVRDIEKPFLVSVDSMEISVLGTHFNVNAYRDEQSISTSLLEGSVKISGPGADRMLTPGQQGIMSRKDGRMKIREVDMDQVVAWKNGLFQFDKADIKTIMRQISRWYNVEIVYTGELPERRVFEGKISRSAQLSEVLGILEFSGVEFSVEGNRILVQ